MQEVATALRAAPQALELYCAALQAAVEAPLRVEMQQLEAKLRRELSVSSSATEARLRGHIIERILTLKCPRCAAAFVDFHGCLALSCRNCSCGFCGVCLEDCGADAHRHVANCRWAGGSVFMREGDVAAAQNRWRRHAIDKFLGQLSAAERASLLRSLQGELEGVGLHDLVPGR